MEINPIDTSLVDRIKDIETRLDASQRARQPYLGDWYEFNVSQISYVSDNVVQVETSIVLRDVFQIGDKVRITQGGGYKYFYIIKMNSTTNQLTINGGDDYTFNNTAFTTFGISKITSPSGFPLEINFTPDVAFTGGSGISTTVRDAVYSMQGNLVYLSYWVTCTYSTKPNGVNIDMPFPQGVTFTIQGFNGHDSTGVATGLLVSGTDILQFTLNTTFTGAFFFSGVVGYIPPE